MNDKPCSRCKIVKPLTEFRKSSIKNGKQKLTYCKQCARSYERERHRLQARQQGRELQDYGPSQEERNLKFQEGFLWCSVCKQWLPINEFYKHRNMKRGHVTYCKKCSTTLLDNHLVSQYGKYRAAAKNRGLVFDLSFDKFTSFHQQPCFYCGVTMKRVGIDRKDNSLGYVEGNCVSCCSSCNVILKRGLNFKEFINKVVQIYANLHKNGIV